MERAFSIRRKLSGFCKKIGIPSNESPLIDNGMYARDEIYFSVTPPYFFRVVERGTTASKTDCKCLNEMYYGIMKLLSYDIAIHREAKQRKNGEDPRRQIFFIQYELLKNLDVSFEEMYLHDIEKLLRVYPFNDPIEGYTYAWLYQCHKNNG